MQLQTWLSIVAVTCLGCCQVGSCAGASSAAEPASPQLALPLPEEADSPLSRWVSQTGRHQVILTGSQYFDSQSASANGAEAYLTGPTGSFAYALYRLALNGINVDSLDIQIQINAGSECWVGLADYGRGTWDWQPWGELMASPLIPDGSYHSCAGSVYLAVAAPAGSSLTVQSLTAEITGIGVGPGQAYSTIESAYADATDGDTILVFAQAGGAPYSQPALQVYKSSITFAGVPGAAGGLVQLDGSGYNYTGAGSTPRAIFQFNPGADGCTVQGFELVNAHNDSYNGAGVRINQANDVTVRLCQIHGCDMGLMSNGDAAAESGANQLVEHCVVYSNGNEANPGYNHNLYMGGHSFTLRACHVYGSLTGHNVKSRAHVNIIEYCYIHDSANRELDLVDDGEDTAAANSHSLVKGSIIAKAESMDGNKHTIHFGQDIGGDHNGTLYLVHNTILTPYISAVIQLSAANAHCEMYNNLIWDFGTGQAGQALLVVSGGATASALAGSHNALPSGMSVAAGHALDAATTWSQAAGSTPSFADWDNPDPLVRDFHLMADAAGICNMGLPFTGLPVPPGSIPLDLTPGWQFMQPYCLETRIQLASPALGAYEYAP